MRRVIFYSCILLISMTRNSPCETLNDWILSKIEADEQLISDSINQSNGHSLDLLLYSQYYVPFFLESPQGVTFSSTDQKSYFDKWVKERSTGFLPGGYIYRINFKTAPPLYAMSGGFWEGNVWRCLSLEKDLAIAYNQVWESENGNYLYATLLGGVPPHLVLYDQQGEIKQKYDFDVSEKNWEDRWEDTKKAYSSNGDPVLEKISLAEYLENPDTPWRDIDMSSSRFNLRNQYHRDDEMERLRDARKWTRIEVMDALQSRLKSNENQRDAKPLHPGSGESNNRLSKSGGSPNEANDVRNGPPSRWVLMTSLAVLLISIGVWIKARVLPK